MSHARTEVERVHSKGKERRLPFPLEGVHERGMYLYCFRGGGGRGKLRDENYETVRISGGEGFSSGLRLKNEGEKATKL